MKVGQLVYDNLDGLGMLTQVKKDTILKCNYTVKFFRNTRYSHGFDEAGVKKLIENYKIMTEGA